MIERKQVEVGSRFDFEERRQALWASEAPRMVGIYPSPVALWAEKTGQRQPDDLSGIEAVQMGHVMQETIRRMFSDQTGIESAPTDHDIRIAKGYEWLRAHTDAVTPDGTIVEIKNFSAFRRKEFGDWGSDDVPMSVYVQCVHEAICWDTDTVYMPVLFGGQEFQVYELHPTQTEKRSYIQRAEKFWERVVKKDPPPPQTAEDVLALFPRETEGAIKTASPDDIANVDALVKIKGQIKELEAKADHLSDLVKIAIGEAGSLMSGTKILATWRASADSKFFDAKAFQQDHADLYKKYTGVRAGSRRFLIK